MSFQYTSGDPDNLLGGAPASMGDIQGPFVDLRDYINARIAAVPTFVTTLPASPVDGQEVYYLADATNRVLWHLRYNAGGSTYKWEAVGTADLGAEVATVQSTSSATYTDLATVGPSITVPRAGEYMISIAAEVTTAATASSQGLISVQIGGVAATDNDSITVKATAAVANAGSPSKTMRRTVSPASTLVKMVYRTDGTTVAFSRRAMQIRPLRVA